MMEEILKTKDPYTHYYALNNSDISRRLAKKRMPDSLRTKLYDQILLAKAEHIKAGASAKRKEYLWKQLLAPAKYEWKMVNLMLTKTQQQVDSGYYANPDEGAARVLALAAYRACIGRWVLDAALDGQKRGDTPLSVAREATKRFPAGMPNDGKHWVDWVPDTVKKEISLLFDAIPHTPKAKRKLPFQRTQRPRRNNPALTRLIKRTEKELSYVKQELDIAPNDQAIRLKYNQMRQALARMHEMKPSEAVPHTWHGLYKFESSKAGN
jgi:hypothetical protein